MSTVIGCWHGEFRQEKPWSRRLTPITAIEIGTLIDSDPRVRGGRPKIAGTGVAVARVAGWYKMGLTPEEIATQYGHISLAQVHAALTYYHANPNEIEADLAAETSAGLLLAAETTPRYPDEPDSPLS